MKIWTIAWKDTLIRLRDRNALILTIAAPLLISAIIGSAFGGFFSGGGNTITDIPFVIVNEDDGELAQNFVDILTTDSGTLADLLEPTEMNDLSAARELVQLGQMRATVHIPLGFSEAIQNGGDDGTTTVALYTDPTATITPNIIRGIVTQITNQFISGGISGQVAVEQILQHIETVGPALADLETVLGDEIEANIDNSTLSLNTVILGESDDINPFAFFVPSMGIFFLVFSMMDGTRSILDEEQAGTLSRLISTPTNHSDILLGKILGVFVTGFVQFTVFMIASRLIFGVNWGSSLVGLALMTLSTIAAFTSLGAFIAAFARDANQANIYGSIVAIGSGALGGNFTSSFNFPGWLDVASKFTINRWSLDGFTDLTLFNLGVADILLETAVLLIITLVFFGLGLWGLRRRITK